MSDEFLDLGGVIVPASAVTLPRAADLATYLAAQNNPYARLVECRREGDSEIIVLDVDVELAQRTANPIHPVERVAVVCHPKDDMSPEVLALRKDFPLVPHLNLRQQEIPRSLCLYEESFADLKLTWTAAKFVERIRTWLAQTAKGTLHHQHQSLEPMLPAVGDYLIIQDGLVSASDGLLQFTRFRASSDKSFYMADRVAAGEPKGGIRLVAFSLECPPQVHGIIRRTPETLKALHEMMLTAGYDLLASLRKKIFDAWADKGDATLGTIFIVRFPKTRTAGGQVEATDVYAFITSSSIQEVGVAIGVLQCQDSRYGLNVPPDVTCDGSDVPIFLMSPLFAFDRKWAAFLNGRSREDLTQIVAVGAGAIGSQVIMNLIRAGIGVWTILDNDVLLPHNLARHALDGRDLAAPKAEAVAESIKITLGDLQAAKAIPVDVMRSDAAAADLKVAMHNAQVILDFSASAATARHLAIDVSCGCRRVSFFVTPSARDSVLLAEDPDRLFRLDSLEMQYYRAILTYSELADHVSDSQERRRYGRTCSDVSATSPQHLIALHSAIGSRAVQDVLDEKQARIRIWRARPDTLSVEMIDVKPLATRIFRGPEWTLVTDDGVLKRLSQLRQAKQGDETGGILLGAFDCTRKIVYVADVLPSPPDSKERPKQYIRGRCGLQTQVNEASRRTGHMIDYVGEWHSHPDGVGVLPSEEDKEVFEWLRSHMASDGYPPVMVIVGARSKFKVMVNNSEQARERGARG